MLDFDAGDEEDEELMKFLQVTGEEEGEERERGIQEHGMQHCPHSSNLVSKPYLYGCGVTVDCKFNEPFLLHATCCN